MNKFKKKLVPIIMGLAIGFFCIWVLVSNNLTVKSVIGRLNYLVYDTFTRTKAISLDLKDNKIAIVYIDEKSIREIGRWPWSRSVMADIIQKIQKAGATVIAMDLIFSEPEENSASQVLKQIEKMNLLAPKTFGSLQEVLPYFAADEKFASALSNTDVILGMILHNNTKNTPAGTLPTAITEISPDIDDALVVPVMLNYEANLDKLQKAAKNGAFLTTFPDEDGIVRRVPLILRYKTGVYPSLALEAVRIHSLAGNIKLNLGRAGDAVVVEQVKLGDKQVNTDAYGQVLVPYQKTQNFYRQISATDVLHGRFKQDDLQNALVFVGISALALGDLHATPVETVFPGVQIQAATAAGLLANTFPTYPSWGKGLELVVVVVSAVISAVLFPFLGALLLALCSILLIAGTIALAFYLWTLGFVLPIVVPVAVVAINAALNLAYGFFFEFRSRMALKDAFGQYVPPQRVALMSENPKQYGFEGRDAQLSVLFSDIVGFSSLSEKLDAEGVRSLLNNFLTPMTKIVFDTGGTIDKYVGDMIMAFWGAPIDDNDHAAHAMTAALNMQKRAIELRAEFVAEGKLPPVFVGIGVNTGEMSVGDMGSKYRRAYTVLGDTVNLASRLEALTRHYYVDIIVSEFTKGKSDDFVYRLLDRVKVKGKTRGVEIFELICSKDEANTEKMAEISAHEQAMQSYFAQNWEEAKAQFGALAAKFPGSKLYPMYMERIAELSAANLGADWDGAYEWHTK